MITIQDYINEGFAIREAKKDLTAFVSQEDVLAGLPGDHSKCAIANSVRRLTGCKAVSVSQSTAYIVFDDDKKIILKYMIKGMTRLMTKLNDVPWSGMISNVMVTLSAPTESETRRAKKARDKKHDKKILEETGQPRPKPAGRKITVDTGVEPKDPECNPGSQKPTFRHSNGLNAKME